MKNLILSSLAVVIALGFSSCSRTNPKVSGSNNLGVTNTTTGAPAASNPVGDVPTGFTKKVVLEEFTGEWCGWCPEGAKIMNDLTAQYPSTFVGVAVHDGDPMEIASINSYLKTLTGVSGYPNGSVDRADAQGRGSWAGDVSAELAKTAKCGLAMVSKTKSNLLNLDVYVGYNAALPTGSKLTVYLIEDDVPQSAGGQHNYSSTVVVDGNWKHSHVLRAVLTADAGDDFTVTVSKKYTKVSFTDIDLSAFTFNDINNVHAVAFVNVDGSTRDVLNAQECTLNETKKWD